MNPTETAPGGNLLLHDTYVNTLAQALRTSQNLANVPGLLKQIINGEMWKRRMCKQTKQEVGFHRFADFVTAYPPEGLGTNLETLRSICRYSGDNEALDALAQVEVGKVGAPEGNRNAAKTNSNNITVCFEDSERGTSATYTLRRLAKEAPALHLRVLAGELSPHAAAVEAGFRQPKYQMPSDPRQAGRYMAARTDRDWFMAFVDAYMAALPGEEEE